MEPRLHCHVLVCFPDPSAFREQEFTVEVCVCVCVGGGGGGGGGGVPPVLS